jgi:NDP-sugar pyrophosphorylase family protein
MVKERISLTMESDLIKKVDSLVNGVKFRSRSHVMEWLLNKALGESGIKKAIILAGGKGTELRPLTYEIPKHMIPIKGRPILEYQIELLRKYDIRDIILSIGYLGSKIKDYFGDGSKFGVKITYVEEDDPHGTGGAIKMAAPLLDETFLILNGHNLVNIDLGSLYEFHKDRKAVVTIALKTKSDVGGFGVAQMEGSRITDFSEKPKKSESNLVNAGVYVAEPSIMDFIGKGKVSLEKDVFPEISSDKRLLGFPFSDQWFSIKTEKDYEEAIKKWRGIE